MNIQFVHNSTLSELFLAPRFIMREVSQFGKEVKMECIWPTEDDGPVRFRWVDEHGNLRGTEPVRDLVVLGRDSNGLSPTEVNRKYVCEVYQQETDEKLGESTIDVAAVYILPATGSCKKYSNISYSVIAWHPFDGT